MTTSAVQPTFGDSDNFNFKCHSRQLAPTRCNLGGGSVWDVVVQPSPGLSKVLSKPVVGRNIGLHAVPADRASTYIVSTFPAHSTSF